MDDSPRSVAAVVLAGGSGSRFATAGHVIGGGHKLDARLDATSVEPEESVAERALRHVLMAAIGPVVVITGKWSPPDDFAIAGIDTAGLRFLHNPSWSAGQITSVRAGIDVVDGLGLDRAVLGLADQPFVSPDAWRTVATAPGPICVATYGGRRGNPVALDQSTWPLLPTTGDEGARALMRIRPDLVREVACSGSPADIDTAEDLHRWQNN
ncbi:MAG: nucleotidyltransferase family protein [Ilumatobacteraceae bacterium]